MKGETEPKRDARPQGSDAPEHEVIEEFYHRLALAPDNTELRLHLAETLAQHGQRLEALEELRILVRLDPNHLVARKLREELLRDPAESSPEVPPVVPRTSEALH